MAFLGLQFSYVKKSLVNYFLQRSSLEQVKGTDWLKSWNFLFVTTLAIGPVCHILTRVRQGTIMDNGAIVKRKLHRGKGIGIV